MTLSYLALGSNLRMPQRQLHRAIRQLRKLPKTHVIKIASFFTSKAWGRKIQPDFYNTVVAIHTSLTPKALLAECQAIENSQGRIRQLKWGARTIDIDIILYGSKEIKTSNLIIPHPQLLHRDFVLLPLLEIAPDIRMPNGQLISELCLNGEYCSTIKT